MKYVCAFYKSVNLCWLPSFFLRVCVREFFLSMSFHLWISEQFFWLVDLKTHFNQAKPKHRSRSNISDAINLLKSIFRINFTRASYLEMRIQCNDKHPMEEDVILKRFELILSRIEWVTRSWVTSSMCNKRAQRRYWCY